MAAPLLRMCRYHAIGGDNRQPEPACRGEHRMSLAAGPELGVEVLGSTEPQCLLEETNITGQEDEPIAIGCQCF